MEPPKRTAHKQKKNPKKQKERGSSDEGDHKDEEDEDEEDEEDKTKIKPGEMPEPRSQRRVSNIYNSNNYCREKSRIPHRKGRRKDMKLTILLRHAYTSP